MFRLLITSSMKSEPGLPCVKLGLRSCGEGAEAVVSSAWARAAEGRGAAGARVSCARALIAPPLAAAAPATATPVKNFRRSTLDELFFMTRSLPDVPWFKAARDDVRGGPNAAEFDSARNYQRRRPRTIPIRRLHLFFTGRPCLARRSCGAA